MSEFKFVKSVFVGKRFSLESVFPENQFFLMKITEVKEFLDGTYTDKITGLSFELVELKNFNRLKVKVDGMKKAFITNEELEKIREAGEQVMVRLKNPTIMVYVNTKSAALEDSIKADGIERITLE